MKILQIAVGIIRNPQNQIFITQRAADAHMANKWEFPGGKIEPGETPENALIRELKEEMNAHLIVDEFFMHVHYDYPTFILEMDCFLCHIPDNHYELLEHEDCKWIIPGQEDVVWVPADLQIIEKLIARNQA